MKAGVLNLFLAVLGLVRFLIAAASVPTGRINMTAASLFYWELSTLI